MKDFQLCLHHNCTFHLQFYTLREFVACPVQIIYTDYIRSKLVLLLRRHATKTRGLGRAVAQEVSSRLPTRRPWFEPRLDHVGFVADNAALGQVFSEYFGFP
jgi:hypothetical protein